MPKNVIKLTELKKHQKGIIHSFEETELYIKLMEMGCIPGEEIVLEMVAPMGDPISIMVAGYNLSIRKNEANKILVEI